ncbi:MAG: hypothetical protein M1826_005204 [Phylliscum demangeonii]|nr:MAG: hypothetical protein M1826_005204 [Phylliscum demangeonii]
MRLPLLPTSSTSSSFSCLLSLALALAANALPQPDPSSSSPRDPAAPAVDGGDEHHLSPRIATLSLLGLGVAGAGTALSFAVAKQRQNAARTQQQQQQEQEEWDLVTAEWQRLRSERDVLSPFHARLIKKLNDLSDEVGSFDRTPLEEFKFEVFFHHELRGRPPPAFVRKVKDEWIARLRQQWAASPAPSLAAAKFEKLVADIAQVKGRNPWPAYIESRALRAPTADDRRRWETLRAEMDRAAMMQRVGGYHFHLDDLLKILIFLDYRCRQHEEPAPAVPDYARDAERDWQRRLVMDGYLAGHRSTPITDPDAYSRSQQPEQQQQHPQRNLNPFSTLASRVLHAPVLPKWASRLAGWSTVKKLRAPSTRLMEGVADQAPRVMLREW